MSGLYLYIFCKLLFYYEFKNVLNTTTERIIGSANNTFNCPCITDIQHGFYIGASSHYVIGAKEARSGNVTIQSFWL